MDYHALEKMTVTSLREEAKKYPDVKAATGMKKEELVDLLAEKMGIEKPHKVHKHTHGHTPLDKPAIKKRMQALRAQRDAARGNADRKKLNILRKQIHTLKRLSRMED